MCLAFWPPISTSAFSLQHLAFRLRPSLSDGSFYTASEAANDEKRLHVANCCRCVASRKAQRNPCKIRLVAVLPIFQTCISILPFWRILQGFLSEWLVGFQLCARVEAMSSKPPQAGSDRRTNAPGGQKPSLVLPAVIVGLLFIGGAIAYKMLEGSPPAAAPVAAPVATVAPTQNHPVVRAIAPREESAETPAAPVAVVPGLAVTAPPARVPSSEPTIDSRQLMATLTS